MATRPARQPPVPIQSPEERPRKTPPGQRDEDYPGGADKNQPDALSRTR